MRVLEISCFHVLLAQTVPLPHSILLKKLSQNIAATKFKLCLVETCFTDVLCCFCSPPTLIKLFTQLIFPLLLQSCGKVDQQISCINIVDDVGFYKLPSLICKQMEAKGGMFTNTSYKCTECSSLYISHRMHSTSTLL